MGRRKRWYPMNLLTELSLNQEMGTNIDYENLSKDMAEQMKSLGIGPATRF